MEFFQTALNPYGQEILVRASWTWLYVIAGVALLFVLIHFVMRRTWLSKKSDEPAPEAPAGLPDKITRHSGAARFFHMVMASSMLVLLVTGFFPIIGIQFAWMKIHWIAGFVLIGTIIYHIIHVGVRMSLLQIWVGPRDIADWFKNLSHAIGSRKSAPRTGKYPVDNKMFHHGIVLASAGVIVTGVMMMKRIEQPFVTRDPYWLTEAQWGVVFVVHGFASMVLVGMTIAHIYFAILPEKRWITMSMINGKISKENYLEHHDPERWKLKGEASESVPPPEAPAEAPADATPAEQA